MLFWYSLASCLATRTRFWFVVMLCTTTELSTNASITLKLLVVCGASVREKDVVIAGTSFS